MNEQTFTLFITQLSNTINHYQYLIILILSACVFVFIKSNRQNVRVPSAVGAFLGIVNVFVGLYLHSKVLNIILDFINSPDQPNLVSSFRCIVFIQIILGTVSLILLVVAAYNFEWNQAE